MFGASRDEMPRLDWRATRGVVWIRPRRFVERRRTAGSASRTIKTARCVCVRSRAGRRPRQASRGITEIGPVIGNQRAQRTDRSMQIARSHAPRTRRWWMNHRARMSPADIHEHVPRARYHTGKRFREPPIIHCARSWTGSPGLAVDAQRQSFGEMRLAAPRRTGEVDDAGCCRKMVPEEHRRHSSNALNINIFIVGPIESTPKTAPVQAPSAAIGIAGGLPAI